MLVADVDAIAERIGDRVEVRWGPETQAHGLRELGIADPNGYYLMSRYSVYASRTW